MRDGVYRRLSSALGKAAFYLPGFALPLPSL